MSDSEPEHSLVWVCKVSEFFPPLFHLHHKRISGKKWETEEIIPTAEGVKLLSVLKTTPLLRSHRISEM